MLQTLIGRGIRPDLIVGTSVGALNGAWLAAGSSESDLRELADLWRGLKRSSVFPTGGYINPTLTIAALTLRLADHVRTYLERPAAVTSHAW